MKKSTKWYVVFVLAISIILLAVMAFYDKEPVWEIFAFLGFLFAIATGILSWEVNKAAKEIAKLKKDQ